MQSDNDENPMQNDSPPQPHAKRRQFFITAVALQLVLLVAISIPSILTLSTGRVITFDTTPVDPWDFFRGDYVTLGYTFSQVPTEETFKTDERAFVVLKRVNETWDATRIQKTKPTALQPDEITLKATVTSFYEKKATVTYGIERVYIPERTGTELKSGDRVQVDVALGDNGLAVIKEVRAKDVPIYKWRFL